MADLTGNWSVNDGASPYNLKLTQLGTHVAGVYDKQDGSIDGVVEGNVLKLRWNQPHNKRGGHGELIIAADGNTMSGTWSYDPGASGGLTGGGQWTFSRQR